MELSQEPDPIPSYNKLANIERFNREEAEREMLHRNDPFSTKLLHASVVLAIIAIAFLFFFKLCWDKEKYLRRNPQHDTGSRRVSMSSGTNPVHSVNDRQTSVFIPELQYPKPLVVTNNKEGCKTLLGPACVCPGIGNTNNVIKKNKGWKRDYDNEPYAPSTN